jgi:hypothetical protein
MIVLTISDQIYSPGHMTTSRTATTHTPAVWRAGSRRQQTRKYEQLRRLLDDRFPVILVITFDADYADSVFCRDEDRPTTLFFIMQHFANHQDTSNYI